MHLRAIVVVSVRCRVSQSLSDAHLIEGIADIDASMAHHDARNVHRRIVLKAGGNEVWDDVRRRGRRGINDDQACVPQGLSGFGSSGLVKS